MKRAERIIWIAISHDEESNLFIAHDCRGMSHGTGVTRIEALQEYLLALRGDYNALGGGFVSKRLKRRQARIRRFLKEQA